MNATHICKIIAAYWPNPLKALQSLALLDNSHQVIDYLLCPESPEVQAFISTLNTGEKHLFIAAVQFTVRHHCPVLLLVESIGTGCLE